MTSRLAQLAEVPSAYEMVREISSMDVPRNSQATFNTSSRTKCRRMFSGGLVSWK